MTVALPILDQRVRDLQKEGRTILEALGSYPLARGELIAAAERAEATAAALSVEVEEAKASRRRTWQGNDGRYGGGFALTVQVPLVIRYLEAALTAAQARLAVENRRGEEQALAERQRLRKLAAYLSTQLESLDPRLSRDLDRMSGDPLAQSAGLQQCAAERQVHNIGRTLEAFRKVAETGDLYGFTSTLID